MGHKTYSEQSIVRCCASIQQLCDHSGGLGPGDEWKCEEVWGLWKCRFGDGVDGIRELSLRQVPEISQTCQESRRTRWHNFTEVALKKIPSCLLTGIITCLFGSPSRWKQNFEKWWKKEVSVEVFFFPRTLVLPSCLSCCCSTGDPPCPLLWD